MSPSQHSHHPLLFLAALEVVNLSNLRANHSFTVERQNLNQEYVFLEPEPPRE